MFKSQVYQKSLLTILDIQRADLQTLLLSSLSVTQLPVLPLSSRLPSSCAQTRCRRCAGEGLRSGKRIQLNNGGEEQRLKRYKGTVVQQYD